MSERKPGTESTITTQQIYERLNPDDPIVRAVKAERVRCIEIIKRYLSPRAGIALARQPGECLKRIVQEIERGE